MLNVYYMFALLYITTHAVAKSKSAKPLIGDTVVLRDFTSQAGRRYVYEQFILDQTVQTAPCGAGTHFSGM